MVSHFFEHLSDLAVAAFNDGYFEPGIVAFADQANFGGSGADAASTFFCDGDATAKFIELGFVGLPGNFHDVDFGNVG